MLYVISNINCVVTMCCEFLKITRPKELLVKKVYFCWASIFSVGTFVFALLMIVNLSPEGKDYSALYAMISMVSAVLAVPFCYQLRVYENHQDE